MSEHEVIQEFIALLKHTSLLEAKSLRFLELGSKEFNHKQVSLYLSKELLVLSINISRSW